ncbi:MAG: ISAs1 family transposase [Dehalococcoidia bacterium]|nr:ISAs1 family transposase [Dehalococcoidia bacterium]
MQCTSRQPAPAIPPRMSSSPPVRLVVDPSSLLAAFASVPDPRRRQGVRFTMAAILALAVVAILSNHLSILAIAEWGATQRSELLRTLGFQKGVTPHQATIQRIFGKLNRHGLSTALERHFGASMSVERARGSEGVAIDGKAQRGRLAFNPEDGPVHALTAFLHDQGIVLAQEPIETDGRTEKAEAELTVAPDLLKRIDWHGRVMTGDALFCQRNLCQQSIDGGGDYLLTVKENQPSLLSDIRLLFDPPFSCPPLDDRREAQTVDNGHGRHYDTRQLIASTDLVGYTDWPGLAQVFRLERTWEERGKTKREVQYGITSLPPGVADASRLLALRRGHWQIENALHRVKDVTFGEDSSLVHLGNSPTIMATLRDTAISLLRKTGSRSIAPRLRYHSRHPEAAVALLIA